MVDDRNIDRFDLEQIFPTVAKHKCPYCSSEEISDPETLLAKLLRLVVFSFWAGPCPFFNRKRRKLAAYRRRKCAECGFEYSIEQTEPMLVAIGVVAALAMLVFVIVQLVRYSH